MELTSSGRETVTKYLQYMKACIPMVVRLSGRATAARRMQPLNAVSPIEVTLLGTTIEVSLRQSWNDDTPMDMRPSGRPIETKEQPLKAVSPMEVTLLGTFTCPFASGVYRQPAAAPPSANRTNVVSIQWLLRDFTRRPAAQQTH